MTILLGDARSELKSVPDGSVRCCVTSPPYFGLRDYGHEGQIGLEHSVDEYINELRAVFREVHRVLADDGTLWLNLGDSYAGGGVAGSEKAFKGKQGTNVGSRRIGKPLAIEGLAGKQLIGIPWRVAFALQADGWFLRSDIIWHKPNPMPESVTDRPTKSHEYLFLLTKRARYYYDHDAIKEPVAESTLARLAQEGLANQVGSARVPGKTNGTMKAVGGNEKRNRRDVWTITTKPFSGAHFAVMPEALVEPCILAGSRPGDTVLDPFAGSGTVGVVAKKHRRTFLGVELNPEYAELAENRINDVQETLF